MNEFVEIIYNELAGKYVQDSPFETHELHELTEDFLKKCTDKSYNAWENLENIKWLVQQNAFQVGFRTAVSLLMSK